MKLAAGLLAASGLFGANLTLSASKETVIVCAQTGADLTAARARIIARKMFQTIGISLRWHTRPSACPAEGIIVKISESTPADFFPRALAYAKPFEGTHILVFQDR